MLLKQRSAVRKMDRLRAKYLKLNRETENVHKSLVLRAFDIVRETAPECAEIYADILETLVEGSVMPDRFGDREKGMGRHYYCSVGFTGRRLSPVKGYYKNGIMRFAKSARTMLEEDYTMALTMWKSGDIPSAAQFFARAVHMVSDMSCLPHATCMTYFSPMRNVHKSYEKLAAAIYPRFVPEQKLSRDKLSMFRDRKSFAQALNHISESQRKEISLMLDAPERELRFRLLSAERAVAALMVRFSEDLKLPPEKAHYLTSGMKCRLFGCISATAEVTESGIRFMPENDETPIERAVLIREFYIAHRSAGYFTLSPVSDLYSSRILCSDCRLRSFDPTDKRQLFHII